MTTTLTNLDHTVRKQKDYRVKKTTEFSTRSLNITGDMTLRVPGREPYNNVTQAEISYTSPMAIRLSGLMTETDKDIDVEKGTLEVSADRENQAEVKLYRENRLTLKDPEITLYRGERKTLLNQVQGKPQIDIAVGKIHYT